jgi:hypothetical protein
MDFLDELYLYGETTLSYRGDSTRYRLIMAHAVPAFTETTEDTEQE